VLFLGFFVCSQSVNHHYNDLAKFGYKPKIIASSFYIFGYTLKTKYTKIMIFSLFPPHLWWQNTSKITFVLNFKTWLFGKKILAITSTHRLAIISYGIEYSYKQCSLGICLSPGIRSPSFLGIFFIMNGLRLSDIG
jgi:hypothetical protein